MTGFAVFVVLSACVSAALAGASANARFVDDFVSRSKMTYTDDVVELAKMDSVAMIKFRGYPGEAHDIVTVDGYIVTMHRIPYGKNRNNQPGKKIPVFFIPGLMAASDSFLAMEEQDALPYLLADDGYDVWLGNCRGNFYGRRHQTLNPDSHIDKTFWQFTWEEIAIYDIPSQLEYITNVTGETRYHYVGHSQGTTTFFALNALMPEYNERFISFHAMAPIVYFKHAGGMATLAPYAGPAQPLVTTAGTGELYRNRGSIAWYTDRFCVEKPQEQSICYSSVTTGVSGTSNPAQAPLLIGHYPAGSSYFEFEHYAQNANTNLFQRYDHGPVKNYKRYGSVTPPLYNLTLVTVPTYLHCAINDSLANPKDVERVALEVGNLKKYNLVDSPAFDHVDFAFGRDVRTLLYDDIMVWMKEAEKEPPTNEPQNPPFIVNGA